MPTRAPRRPAARTRAKAQPEPEVVEEDDIEELDEETEPTPAPKRRATRKAAPKVVEPEEDELEDVDDDAEELEDEDDEPKAKKGPKRAPIEFGSAWLAEHVNDACGTSHTPYSLRTIIRSLVKKGEYDRAVGEDRSRYEFTGPKDPRVLAIVKAIKAGAGEKKERTGNADNLAKARAARAKNLAAKRAAEAEEDDDVEETPAPRRRKAATKKAAPKVVEEIEEDDEFEELEDDE